MGWFVLAWVLAAAVPAESSGQQSSAQALSNWPQWRGPSGTGAADGRGYPLQWGPSTNLAWKFQLPGIGASTPAIWEDRIVVTTEKKGQNAVICVDRSGRQQWEVLLGNERAARNRKASGSNPSPATDGQHIAVYFKSGDLACLDFAGATLWRINLQQKYGEDTLWWDLGTSPVLTSQHVVVACMQSGDSYLAAFDKQTGAIAWKQLRELDAPGESAQSYTTPVVAMRGDLEMIYVLGADHVTAHRADTGEQLWIVGGLNPRRRGNYRSIASPVVADDLLIAPYGRGSTLTAIRLGGRGDVTQSHVVWTIENASADVPTPAVANQRVYVCGDRGKIAVLDLETGKLLAQAQAARSTASYSSSPVVADGHLYVTNEDGVTSVFQIQPESLELVAENRIEEFTVATPVFVDGRIYVRADSHLFCVERQ